MLLFKPVLQASRSFFSFSSISPRILWAFSTPEGYETISTGEPVGIEHQRTYAELDRHREEIKTSFFRNGLPTSDAWEVYKRWLDNAFLAFAGLD